MIRQRTPIKKRHHIRPLARRPFPGALDSRSYVVVKNGVVIRVRLFGADYEDLRFKAWMRSRGKCECGCGQHALWPFEGTPASMLGELSHNEHGARKSDELDRVKWMRHECHMKSHNCGGRPLQRQQVSA